MAFFIQIIPGTFHSNLLLSSLVINFPFFYVFFFVHLCAGIETLTFWRFLCFVALNKKKSLLYKYKETRDFEATTKIIRQLCLKKTLSI